MTIELPPLPTHDLTQRVPSDPRDYLTLRVPRTLREADNDPMSWRQSGRDAIAEEEQIRRSFEPAADESRSSVWAHRVLYAIALGVGVAMVWGKL